MKSYKYTTDILLRLTSFCNSSISSNKLDIDHLQFRSHPGVQWIQNFRFSNDPIIYYSKIRTPDQSQMSTRTLRVLVVSFMVLRTIWRILSRSWLKITENKRPHAKIIFPHRHVNDWFPTRLFRLQFVPATVLISHFESSPKINYVIYVSFPWSQRNNPG